MGGHNHTITNISDIYIFKLKYVIWVEIQDKSAILHFHDDKCSLPTTHGKLTIVGEPLVEVCVWISGCDSDYIGY